MWYKKELQKKHTTTEGYGSSMPIANNSKEAGRAKNRRVEVIFE